MIAGLVLLVFSGGTGVLAGTASDASHAQPAKASRAQYLMGTVLEIEARQGIEEAFAEAARIEGFLSTWRESELSRLNKAGRAVVSAELYDLLNTAMQWCQRTDGAFSPLVGPLIEAWKTRDEGALPAAEALRRARARTEPGNVRFQARHEIELTNGAALEEGAFGKGYAIDRMMARLPARDVMINFGGQIAVRGTRTVSIANPDDRHRPAVALVIENASLSTSSGSEKRFRIGGRTFTHIIDPRSGEALPPRGSVSVIAPDALTADILSTALYVMGPDAGLRWAGSSGVAALFLTENHEARMTSAFRRQARDLRMLDTKYTLKD